MSFCLFWRINVFIITVTSFDVSDTIVPIIIIIIIISPSAKTM